jgi:GxxExxY protein
MDLGHLEEGGNNHEKTVENSQNLVSCAGYHSYRAEAQRMTENEIGTIVLESAIAVHRELGPGLLETVYEVVLARELQDRGLNVERQVPVAIQYKEIRFDEGFRADIIVDSKVILELKSVEHVSAAHKKQVQTYLRLTGCKLGYLLNFGEALMKAGITRCVNGLEE